MHKKEYLDNIEVAGFVDWLAIECRNRIFHMNIKNSRYVSAALHEDVDGIEGLLESYCWKSSWQHPDTGERVTSSNWKSTQESTARLGAGLRDAIDKEDEELCHQWSLCILKWGGVSGAKYFLKNLADAGQLVAYLRSVEPLLALDRDNDDAALQALPIRRFDAGLTKVHAFIDQTGSPIYDSRVGAAISMFVSIYTRERKVKADLLKFPSGEARGDQFRNPGDLGYANAPKFYTQAVSFDYWARSQLRLGWIIEAVVERGVFFAEYATEAERIQAFQAALFMAGYDLRCFTESSNTVEISKPNVVCDERERFRGVVPSGFSMSRVVHNFRKYYETLVSENPTRGGFVNWQVDARAVGAPATANANSYPFMDSELAIYDRSAVEIESLFAGGYDSLLNLVGHVEPAFDEREHNCLICTFLAGVTYEDIPSATERKTWLVDQGFAGTEGSAGTLLSVGRSFGRFFDLISVEPNMPPTKNFDQYFSGEAWQALRPVRA